MENSIDSQNDYVVTKEYLLTYIRGTFKDVNGKCKFVKDKCGNFYLNPLSSEMCYVTDSRVV